MQGDDEALAAFERDMLSIRSVLEVEHERVAKAPRLRAFPPPHRRFRPPCSAHGGGTNDGKLAMRLCRECLGWPDACAGGRSIIENRRRPELPHAHSRMNGFQLDPTDLGQVLNAVKEWCDSSAVSLSLQYSPGGSRVTHAVCQAGLTCGDPRQ